MTNDDNAAKALTAHPWFFVGIGGSGMLPLATILKGRGAQISGSDRSFDQGRTPEKFAWLERQGFELHPQDGSGITSGDQVLVASAAVEDNVPEMVRAKELGCSRMTRAGLNSALFNAAHQGIAIGGTSGKSTVTGMLGWIMQATGRDPTIMNGAVMTNFVNADAPFASAVVGGSGTYVSEVDESDGTITLYRPAVAVLLNVSLDHKSMEELRILFGDYLAASGVSAINADDAESMALVDRAREVLTFGIDAQDANIGVKVGSADDTGTLQTATIIDRRDGSEHALTLAMPGKHNLSNALAAIAGAAATGMAVSEAVAALGGFKGLARRFNILGTTANNITVIDDFGHNPEKCAATLRTLKSHEGRVIAFFQPHGYGPLRQMGDELAEIFARELDADDITIFSDPVYFGGTTDMSEGSERIINLIRKAGGTAEYVPDPDGGGDHIASRNAVADHIVEIAKPGDRIVVMGARDDTLTAFAQGILERL